MLTAYNAIFAENGIIWNPLIELEVNLKPTARKNHSTGTAKNVMKTEKCDIVSEHGHKIHLRDDKYLR